MTSNWRSSSSCWPAFSTCWTGGWRGWAGRKAGWFIASIYLICGAFRLARFNCLAAMSGTGGGKYFLGFPIPAAAGLVASLTLLIIQLNEKEKTLGHWKYLLAVVLVFLSAMMVSTVKYPTFKTLDFRATRTFNKMLLIVVLIGLFVLFWDKILHFVLPVLFTVYLLYGFIRPFISRQMRHDIEDEEGDDAGEDEP